jgi:hypothetical protein
MRLRQWVVIALFASCAVAAEGQEVCPCVPVAHEWIVSACESWNCAASAAIMANGSADVLTMPSGSDDFKWIVIRRVAAGSAIVSPDSPFKVETFQAMLDAANRYVAINPDFRPLLLSAPDGNVLVISRSSSQPRRRAATR